MTFLQPVQPVRGILSWVVNEQITLGTHMQDTARSFAGTHNDKAKFELYMEATHFRETIENLKRAGEHVSVMLEILHRQGKHVKVYIQFGHDRLRL